MRLPFVCAAILLSVLTMVGAPVNAQESPSAIVRARNAVISHSVTQGSAAAIAAVYAINAEFTQPGDRIKTRESIQGMWQSQIAHGLSVAEFTTTDADLAAGTITEHGTFVFKAKGGKVMATGKYVNTWTRQGASWLIQTNAVTPDRK